MIQHWTGFVTRKCFLWRVTHNCVSYIFAMVQCCGKFFLDCQGAFWLPASKAVVSYQMSEARWVLFVLLESV